MSRDVHALAPEEFLEEVHSFEFWLHSVEGYLADTEFAWKLLALRGYHSTSRLEGHMLGW